MRFDLILKERDERIAELEAAIKEARIKISGGLCYHSANSKHAQLIDADEILRVVIYQPQDPEPEEKCPRCNGDCGGADLMCPLYGCCCEWIEGRWMRSIDCPIHGNQKDSFRPRLHDHDYHPSAAHMGDCSICGNIRDHPIHSKQKGE